MSIGKSTKVSLVVILMLLFIGGLGASTFTPIFCKDYEFTCCNEIIDSTTIYQISDEIAKQCPTWASRCEILSISANNVAVGYEEWGVGSQNCGITGLVCKGFECDNEQLQAKEMKPGDYVWLDHPCLNSQGTVELRIWKRRLDFTGSSASQTGVPVLGADQCHFNPEDGKVYDVDTEKKIQAVSYTVPLFECILSFPPGLDNRKICGYKEESCSRDSDCGEHTYGNFECSGRTLKEYGCVSFGKLTSLEKDRLPSDNEWGKSNSESLFGNICDVVSAKQVQCCGDTDCGTNFFCNRETWTCKEKVICSKDTDCGVSEQCDFTISSLKKPICNLGICDFKETNVECCSDVNCPGGYYCNTNRECKERIAVCVECPYECCVDNCKQNGGFFDRLCPDNKPYCVDHACQIEPLEDCGKWTIIPGFAGWDGWQIPDLWCLLILWIEKFKLIFSIVVGLIGGLLAGSFTHKVTKNQEQNKRWIIIGIVFIILSVSVGILAYIYFWWIILALIILGIVRAFIPGI